MNGVLDYGAVNFIMDLYKVQNRRDIFERVLFCFGIYVKMQKQKEGKHNG